MAGVELVLSTTLSAPAASGNDSWQVLNTCNKVGNAYFWPAGPDEGWTVHTWGASPAGCHLWTWTHSSGGDVNYGNWYLPATSHYDATYFADAFIPCDWHNQAPYVRYKAYPYGTVAGPYSIVGVDQRSYCDSWVVVFNRYFDGDQGGSVRVTDYTIHTWAAGYQMAVDSFWFIR